MASSNMSTIYDLWTTDGGEFVAAVVLLGKFELDSILAISQYPGYGTLAEKTKFY